MNTHPVLELGCTQCAKIREILEENFGEWVAMPHLAIKSGSMAVATRVSNLNEVLILEGKRIENRVTRQGSKAHSFYRMINI